MSSDEAGDEVHQGHQGAVVVLPEFGGMRAQSWADRSKKMQGSTAGFVKSSPGPTLVLALVTMRVSVSALHAIEAMAAED